MKIRLCLIFVPCAALVACEAVTPIATQMAEQYVASLMAPPAPPPPPEYAGGYPPPPAGYTTEPPPPPPPGVPPPPITPSPTRPPVPISHGFSALSGGGGGGGFKDAADPWNGSITAIHVRHGALVDAVQVVTRSVSGKSVALPRHGGLGGRLSTFTLQPGEYVTGISGRSGQYVDSLQIRTNKRVSPKYGGNGGANAYSFYVPGGSRFAGFHGRSGALVDAVGLVYAKTGASPSAYAAALALKQQAMQAAAAKQQAAALAAARARLSGSAQQAAVTQVQKGQSAATMLLKLQPSYVPRSAGAYSVLDRSGEKRRFDCATVDDEYEELMFGEVLVNPGDYVATLGGRISREQFEDGQRGRLRLPAARAGRGVALLRTSAGARAKFLFAWVDEGSGVPLLEVVDATVYAGDADGSSTRLGTIVMAPGSAVDLDPAEGPAGDSDAFDVGYRVAEDGQLVLESLGEAAVEFPTESLCGTAAAANAGGDAS